jgi:hypothetical protein
MSYYISKPSRIDPNITVYYAGDNRWTDDASQKATFPTESVAAELIDNPDGTNGGWTGSTVVAE